MRNVIGCDWHPRHEEIAILDAQTGELIERHLGHENGEARVGIEATG